MSPYAVVTLHRGDDKGQWQPIRVGPRESANLRCPTCGALGTLLEHSIAVDGTVQPSVVCPMECGFHAYLKLEGWEQKEYRDMTIRCKFRCTEVTKREHWNRDKGFIYDAKFQAVSDGSEEDKRFFAATPSGSLVVGTVTEGHFEPGKSYYVDITPAD